MKKQFLFLAAMTAAANANAEKMWVDGHECVDLGLSVYWATCNVGANSPEDYGDCFAWGEVQPKEIYTNDNYEYNDLWTDLDADHDAATQKWGANWRMPTATELQELIDYCEWNLEENGYVLKNNGDSILLPLAGLGDEDGKGFCSEIIARYYARSSNAVFLDIMIGEYAGIYVNNGNQQGELGCSVRPVCEKSAYTKLNYVEKDNVNTIYKTIENGQIVIIKNGVKYNLSGKKL